MDTCILYDDLLQCRFLFTLAKRVREIASIILWIGFMILLAVRLVRYWEAATLLGTILGACTWALIVLHTSYDSYLKHI